MSEPYDPERGGGEADAGPSGPFPWPPPEDESWLVALYTTWRESVFQPTRFFRAMPTTGTVWPAVLYYLIVGIVAAAFNLYWSTVFRAFGPGPDPTAEAVLDAWSPLVGFLLAPLSLLLVLVVGFAVIHVLLLLLGGANRGAGTTFRALCFAYGPAIFTIVPVLGGIVAFVWMIVITVIGLREAHRTDGWRAGLAVVLPFILFVVLTILAVFMAVVAVSRIAF